MKKAAAVLTAFLLIIFIMVPAFAAKPEIKIDGIATNNKEWAGAQDISLLSKEATGNEFTDINMQYIVDYGNNVVYYLFVASEKDSKSVTADEIAQMGISFIPEGCEEITLRGNNPTAEGSYGSTHSYKAAMTADSQTGTIYCEIKVNYKDGVPADIRGSVKFFDKYGEASNKININNDVLTKTDTTNKEKTTKEKTTTKKSTTAKETTTRRVHNPKNKTVITTTKRVTTTKAIKTTKATTTTAVKTTRETAKTNNTTTSHPTEVILDIPEETDVYYPEEETNSEPATDDVVAITEETTSASAFGFNSIQKSSLYKIITALCALVLFGVLGVWAVKSRQDDDEDN
ncbi:MAG: hypothetical protein MJ121_00785 [Clostridia bacterium]|nr:hypothetical protein [Clostridia bacterium]